MVARVPVLLVLLIACGGRPAQPSGKVGMTSPVFLEDITWVEAERLLTRGGIVALPRGAASKEHGPHLRLANDWLLADALRRRVAARTQVVVAPILGASFYPAFVEYPGSISLRLETARDVIVDVVRSLARH